MLQNKNWVNKKGNCYNKHLAPPCGHLRESLCWTLMDQSVKIYNTLKSQNVMLVSRFAFLGSQIFSKQC